MRYANSEDPTTAALAAEEARVKVSRALDAAEQLHYLVMGKNLVP
jgi:hypothetical protein